MKIRSLEASFRSAVLVTVGLWLASAAPQAWGQFGATLLSATPQSPITLGQPLSITVVVRNDTGDTWLAGDLGASWLTELDQPSWFPGATPIDFDTRTTVPDGVTAAMTVTLEAANLPSAPGSYSLRVFTAYNLWDLDFYLMTGAPKTVGFTINPAMVNHAPVITPVGLKAVVVTNLLSFKVSVLDTDLPPQTLTFDLEPGAPSGATLEASSGQFNWIPPIGPTPRTNQMSVRVTDDGSPPLSATNTFRVVVLPPPRFQALFPSGGAVTLVWSSFPSKTYRVSYKEALGRGAWTNLGGDVVATGPVLSLTNNLGPARQRFYRLSILD